MGCRLTDSLALPMPVFLILLAIAAPTVVWSFTYFLPLIFMKLLGPQDLKKKYNAQWALVTGGSSGIGRAIVDRLAMQGLNVCVVSMDDDLLKNTVKELQSAFPKQEFRAVGVLFAPGQAYLPKIISATKDIDVQIIFNNAGYILTGFFDSQPLEKQLANVECNATAAVGITHHFLQKLIQKKLPGCIVFTSSVSGYMPSPFSSMYGATKAFLSQFAACLAVEVKSRGIDVMSVHPSPVASRFYEKTHQMEMLDMVKKTAVAPDELPSQIFSGIGRCHWYDQGTFAVLVRAGTAPLAYNAMVQGFAAIAHCLPDFIKYNKER
ncbi:short-chain dehydrogenase reductase [Nannochloropsis gaditana]|uniref:Short-chain dehydrogenase reductase n=1 Tax=Nannochloropsis gaditana TaxID=72520 RepID=W7TW17_9STRA|nr:short-chain dehydrogenase reductase [Nannochloropsis gaditana]